VVRSVPGKLEEASVLEHLRGHLPAYMVPALVLLEQLPLTIERGADYEPAAFSVVVSSEAPAETVTSIGAPGANFGA